MLEHVNRGGVDILIAEHLGKSGFMVAFSGRKGGNSTGDYSSLNLSYNVGDDSKAVNSNRELLSDILGIKVESWVFPQQVHGCVVKEIGVHDIGRGSRDFTSGILGTDGLVTAVSGVAIGVLTADCIPVVLVAPKGRAVAVAHAGWRGVISGVVVVAARKLAAICGSSTEELHAFIGPHIRSCCMEVDSDVSELFANRFEDTVVKHSAQGKAYINLAIACSQQLQSVGLLKRNVFDSGICTACESEYFSYRSSGGRCGRQGAIAAVIDGGGL